MALKTAIWAMLVLFLGLLALSAYRRRHSIARMLRVIFIAMSCYLLTFIIAMQFTKDTVKALLFALLVEVVVAVRIMPRRKSRYISRRDRRRVIERFERSGRHYDPRRHHIDHVIPHSRGGGNRADNLRVIDSEENLAKSDQSPWWDIFSR